MILQKLTKLPYVDTALNCEAMSNSIVFKNPENILVFYTTARPTTEADWQELELLRMS